MIKLFCNYCESELQGMAGGELRYVRLSSPIEGPAQPLDFHEHLCEKCLDKAQKAMKPKEKKA